MSIDQPAAATASEACNSTDAAATATLVLAPDPAAVRSARAFVQARCADAGISPDVCDTAVLLASEVVTNAFLHGRSQTHLSVSINADALHVEVRDDNSRHPTLAEPDQNALDGRGMTLVELLATAWGVRDEDLGKTVWFTLGANRSGG